MVGSLTEYECNVFSCLVFDKADKNHYLDQMERQDNLRLSSYTKNGYTQLFDILKSFCLNNDCNCFFISFWGWFIYIFECR